MAISALMVAVSGALFAVAVFLCGPEADWNRKERDSAAAAAAAFAPAATTGLDESGASAEALVGNLRVRSLQEIRRAGFAGGDGNGSAGLRLRQPSGTAVVEFQSLDGPAELRTHSAVLAELRQRHGSHPL